MRPPRLNRRATDQPVWRGGRLDRRTALSILGGAGLIFAGALGWMLSRTPHADDAAPAWSPDGTRLVFVTGEHGEHDLALMARDGSGRHIIEAAGSEGGPVFSPDGARIAFDSDPDGNRDIFVMDADGGAVRRLTSHPAQDWAPAWSADGTRVVFTSDRDARGGSDIYQMRADGTGVERLTRTGKARHARPAPDDTEIALEVDGDVHVLSLADRRLRRLTYAPDDGQRPAWAPDGQRLAFVTQRRGRPEIFTVDRSGRGEELLVSMTRGGATDPSWSRDGTHVVFVHVPVAGSGPLAVGPAGTLYLVEIGTGRLTRLSP